MIRARLAYEADPAGFAARYAEAEPNWRPANRRGPRARVPDVVLPDKELRRIAALCAAFDVDGMRADLVVARTAVAHAAWAQARPTEKSGRARRTSGWPPNWRCRTGAGATRSTNPGLDPDAARRGAGRHASARPRTRAGPAGRRRRRSAPSETPAPQGDGNRLRPRRRRRGQVRRPRRRFAPGRCGCRAWARARPGGARGRATAPAPWWLQPPNPMPGDGLHLFATLLSAAGRQSGAGGLRPAPDDVRRAMREGREGNLVIFVVDASGSMAARDRMSAVSGAALSLLRDAYQRRDKVAVITFRGGDAGLLLPPTSSATSPAAGWPVSTPAAKRRWRTACWPPATWWSGSGCGTGRAAAWSWCSPTVAPPVGPTRWAARARPRPGWSPRVRPRWSWTAKRLMSGWVWPASLAAHAGGAGRCGWISCAPTI